MCIALPVAALLVSMAGAATSGVAAYQQGQSSKAAAEANANAQRQTAISVENTGADNAAQQEMKARKVASAQTAAAAAGGVVTTSGTPAQLQSETATFGELDALRITNNAQRSAWGYQTQAGIDTFQGNAAATGSTLGAGASLLGGASNAYFGYSKMTN